MGAAPGEGLDLINIARMGRLVFLHITGIYLLRAYEDTPSWGALNEKGKPGPIIFKEKLPKEFIGKSVKARSFVISICDYTTKDDAYTRRMGSPVHTLGDLPFHRMVA